MTAPEQPKKLYRVQVGAFSTISAANSYANTIKKAGFQAFVIRKNNKLWAVQVGAFSVKANADAYMKKIKAAGFPAFVLEVT
ncbi:MAG: SPOR domain-containing protein [Oscillospiraceae bacterium]